jgi:U4/U6.U5 small nuclear ribonucleoproteins
LGEEEEEDEEEEMRRLMGFGTFDTTKEKHVDDNTEGAGKL